MLHVFRPSTFNLRSLAAPFMKFMMSLIVIAVLVGCDSKREAVQVTFQPSVNKPTTISGSILGFASVSNVGAAAAPGALSCSAGVVKLYRTTALGEKSSEVLATASVTAAGTFKFAQSAPYQADLKVNPTKIRALVLELSGCSKVYRRFVTGVNAQDISAGSELTSYLAGTVSLANVSSADYEALVSSLKTASDAESAYNLITTDASLAAKFQTAFGVASADLPVTAPQLNEISVPSTSSEGTPTSLGTTIVHWNTAYTSAQEWLEVWTEDGVEKTKYLSNQVAFNWTPSSNSQGSRKIRLVVGQDNGMGRVDTTKSVRVSDHATTVADTTPASVPSVVFNGIVASGMGYTNQASISLTMTTGALGSENLYASCTNFSKLAVTVSDDGSIVIPTDSDWTLTCSSANTQSIPVTFAAVGAKQIQIWARDSAGQVTPAPLIVPVHYSTNAPAVTIAVGGAASRNAAAFVLNGTCESMAGAVNFSGAIDNGSGQSSFQTPCTSDVWSTSILLTGVDGNKVVTAAQTNVFGTTTSVNRAYTKDTVAPAVTIASPSSLTRSKSGITLAGSCEAGLSIAFSGIGLAANSSAACSGTYSQALTFSATDGNKLITVSQTDAAGNLTTVSQTYVRDNVAPSSPTMVLTSSAYSNSTNVTFTVSCAADVSQVLYSQSVVAPAENDASWKACTATDAYLLSMGDGAKTIYGYSKDSSGNVSSVGSTVAMVLDQTAPVISLTSLTGGGVYAGASSQSISWTASDTNFAATPIALAYSQNSGSTYGAIATVANSSPYAWTVPSLNIATARIRLTATDRAGNTTTAASSSNFTIDSTRPAAPTVTRASNAVSSSTSASINITCTADYAAIQTTSTNTQPLATAGTWVACSTPVSHTVATPDGAKSVYVWTKDTADNVSSTAGSVAMTLDQTPPVIAVTSPAIGFRGGSTATLAWTLTETNVAASTNFMVELFNGSTWTSVGTMAATAGINTNTAYSLTTIAIPSLNISTAQLRVTIADAAAQTVTTPTSAFLIDSSAPTVTSMIINNGDAQTGSAFVNMKVGVSDVYGAVTQVRFAETSTGGSCQSVYADTGWLSYANATTAVGYSLAVVDGVKKVCAWAKDSVGNVSVISPVEGTADVNFDTIEFFIGNPPVITTLSVHDGSNGENFVAGTPITIAYSMTDAEGLNNAPINLYASVNGAAYTTIATNYGSLSGNPTTFSGSYLTFPAPNGAFRIKLVVRDSNNNSSVAAISNAMNATPWSTYMGTRDNGIGTGAKSTSMNKGTYGVAANQFAVNPVNGDIYAISASSSVVKISASTGLTSVFITQGSFNFVDGMSISGLRANTGAMSINFDKQGRLYVMNPEGAQTSSLTSKLWQIDFDKNKVNFYAGGGTLPRASAVMPTTKTEPEVMAGSFDIDDAGSIYYFSPCDPSTYVSGTATLSYRLMKMTQKVDGTVDTFSPLAGDCSTANPVIGSSALLTGLGRVPWTHIRHVSVNSNGSMIYVIDSGVTARYVYDAGISAHRAYSTGLGGRGVVIDRATNSVYTANASVYKTTFASGLTGAETTAPFVTSTGTGNCNIDGTLASAACINAYGSNGFAPLEMANDGTLLFTDTKFRIRYIDSNSKIRTLAGTLPFYGEGLDRSFARGNFRGIHYKTSNNGLGDFPKGLYFVEDTANVLGYVDPNTNLVSVVAGNQRQLSALPASGAVVGPNSDLGSAQEDTNFAGLNFDSDGYPMFIAGGYLYRLGAGKVAARWGGGSTRWQNAAHDAATSTVSWTYYFGNNNLVTVGNNSVYGLGVQTSALQGALQSNVGFVNLTESKYKQLMSGTASNTNPVVADSSVPATVNSSALSSACWNGSCYMVHNPVDGKIYFSEGNVIRALNNHTDRTTVTLSTVHSLGRNVYSFTFSPDNNRIYYVSNDRQLYCKWIGTGGAPANCSNSAALGPFAAQGFTTLEPGAPNRFAFTADGTLLISNGAEVLKYIYTP